MPHKRRPLDRDEAELRDTSLFVIASEDKHAVEQYFNKFTFRRVKFAILPTKDTASSPNSVFERIVRFKDEYQFGDDDQFWVVIDTDHWIQSNHIHNLRYVLQECFKKKIQIAISNPCFELWLLLHFRECPAGLLACGQCESTLKEVASGYNKKNIGRLPITVASVHDAITRARAIDNGNRIPKLTATRLYKLLEQMNAKGAMTLTGTQRDDTARSRSSQGK